MSETRLRGSYCSDLEDQIVRWILFEYSDSRERGSSLAGEKDLPNTAVEKALQQNPELEERLLLLTGSHRAVSVQRARFILRYTENEKVRRIASECLRGPLRQTTDRKHYQTIGRHHGSENRYLKKALISSVRKSWALPKEKLEAVVERFGYLYDRALDYTGI